MVLVPAHPPHLQLQAQFFNWAQDPVVINETALNRPPEQDNKVLQAIKLGYAQLHTDILSAVANGDGKPIADATPPSMWLQACPARAKRYRRAERFKLGIPEQALREPIPRKGRKGQEYLNKLKGIDADTGRDGPSNRYPGSDPGGNKNKGESMHKGIFTRLDLNKGLGVTGDTAVPSFDFRGNKRALCLKFATKGINCSFGGRCTKYHLSEKAFCNMGNAAMQEIDNMVNSLPNVKMADGYTKDSRAATKSQLNGGSNGGGGKPNTENNPPANETPSSGSEKKG